MKTEKPKSNLFKSILIAGGLSIPFLLPTSVKATDSSTIVSDSKPSVTEFYSEDNEAKDKQGYALITTGQTKGSFSVKLPKVKESYFPNEKYIDVRIMARGDNLDEILQRDDYAIDRLEVLSNGSLRSVRNESTVVLDNNTDAYLKAVHSAWLKTMKRNESDFPLDQVYFMVTSKDRVPLCKRIFVEESSPFYQGLLKILTPEQLDKMKKASIGYYGWLFRTAKTDKTANHELLGKAKQKGDEIRLTLTEEQYGKILKLAENDCGDSIQLNSGLKLSLGYSGLNSTLTVPRYNSRGVEVGKSSKTTSMQAIDSELEGKLLLPYGILLSADGKAQYVFTPQMIGGKGLVGLGYSLGNVSLSAGPSGLLQRIENSDRTNTNESKLGAGAKLAWQPTENSEVSAMFNKYALIQGNKLNEARLRLRGNKGPIEGRLTGTYTESSIAKHADVDARVMYNRGPLGIYGEIGYGNLIDGPQGVKENTTRFGVGLEYVVK